MTPAVAAGIGLAATAISTGVGMYSSIAQAKNQAEQQQASYEYQSKLAERNANIAAANQEIANQEASAIRKEGYDEMVAKNQETAALIGKQRAAAAASGAALDVGSLADVNQDTASKGAIDATNIYNKALDEAYNKQVEAWNYGNTSDSYSLQSQAYQTQADNVSSTTGYLNAAATGLSGIASGMNTYANWSLKNGQSNALSDTTTKTNSLSKQYGLDKYSGSTWN